MYDYTIDMKKKIHEHFYYIENIHFNCLFYFLIYLYGVYLNYDFCVFWSLIDNYDVYNLKIIELMVVKLIKNFCSILIFFSGNRCLLNYSPNRRRKQYSCIIIQ